MKGRYYYIFQTTVLFVTMTLISANIISAQDVCLLVKILYYTQTSASAPSLQGCMFYSDLNCSGSSTVTNATLTPPGRSPITMDADWVGEFSINREYLTQAALDADFPNGNYIIATKSINYTNSISVSLTGNTYPTTPQISNFTAAQSINPNADFTLTWNALGLTINDYVKVEIFDASEEDTIYETPEPMTPGALTGNLTSFTIPANTLCPGAQFKVNLIAAKIINVVTNNNPDGTKTIAISTYAKILSFPIKTTGSSVGLISWDKPNFVFFFPEGLIIGTNMQYTTPRTIQNYNMYFQVNDSNPTNSVLFTGPFGSGLTNTPSSWFNINGTYGGYSSPVINLSTPNQITGGIYTITYKGINLKFNLPNPQATNKQIFLVPEFAVGADGMLKQIKWSYLRSDGAKVPPQSYMEVVGISMNSKYGGTIFQNWELRPAFTNYVLTNAVIKWSDIESVQIGFNDVDNNNFMTIYRTSSTPTPPSITTTSLSGTMGQYFSAMLNASGGMYPYKWSIEYGFLPGGLVLDELSGLILGTPGEYGSFKVNVRVEDSLGASNSKDIYVLIAPGTFTHKPAFTNLTKIGGLPSVTLLTMPQQFYRLEISEDLKNWKTPFFFTAPSNQMVVTVPQYEFQTYNKLFFRLALGHKFNSDFWLTFFANAGTINSNSPYTVAVNYPVSISGYHATFTAQFDPDYATLSQVYFGNPINKQPTQIYGKADEDDPGTIAYTSDLNSGIPSTGTYSVAYKGTNLTFNVMHQARERRVIPLPVFTVNSGVLTGISWSYRNPSTAAQYSSLPSFITELSIQIDDVNGNRIYDYDVENLNTTIHMLQTTVNWSAIRTVYMAYSDDLNTHFVITFTKN
ncbi:MAG: putative Ig domain-containing protein [Verrucomicrobiae bacterium]|nr:putative Ig domain-containing protein [Verrucomicrobiae bacterium]